MRVKQWNEYMKVGVPVGSKRFVSGPVGSVSRIVLNDCAEGDGRGSVGGDGDDDGTAGGGDGGRGAFAMQSTEAAGWAGPSV